MKRLIGLGGLVVMGLAGCDSEESKGGGYGGSGHAGSSAVVGGSNAGLSGGGQSVTAGSGGSSGLGSSGLGGVGATGPSGAGGAAPGGSGGMVAGGNPGTAGIGSSSGGVGGAVTGGSSSVGGVAVGGVAGLVGGASGLVGGATGLVGGAGVGGTKIGQGGGAAGGTPNTGAGGVGLGGVATAGSAGTGLGGAGIGGTSSIPTYDPGTFAPTTYDESQCDPTTTYNRDVIIDEFSDTQYLQGVTCLLGSLTYANSAVLDVLSRTDSLLYVRGSVTVSNTSLRSPAFPQKLVHIGGDLIFENNADLIDTEGFDALRILGGKLSVSGNPLLTRVYLPALSSVGSTISVVNNIKLTSTVFLGLRQVGGAFTIDAPALQAGGELPLLEKAWGGIRLAYLGSANSVLDFPKLTYSGGALEFAGLEGRTVSFPALEWVHGAFTISAARRADHDFVFDRLIAVEGNLTLTTGIIDNLLLPALRYVNGAIAFGGNQFLRSVSMPLLEKVTEGLVFDGKSAPLTSFTLPRLVTLGGNLAISNFPSLSGIDAPLMTSAGGLSVSVVLGLNSVSFPKLRTVTGSFSFATCRGPTSFEFGALESTGPFTITDTNLTNLTGFPSLTRIDGDLAITNNPALVSITGFPKLVEVTTSAYINENALLEDVSGLSQITTIGTSTDTSAAHLGWFQFMYSSKLRSFTSHMKGFVRVEMVDVGELTTLAFPELTTFSNLLYVGGGTKLACLSTPQLVSIPPCAITIVASPALAACKVASIYQQAGQTCAQIAGRLNDAGICPVAGCP